MRVLTISEAKAILRIARDLLIANAPDVLFVSQQRYFEAIDLDFVADFFMRLKKLPPSIKPKVAEALSQGQVDSKIWLLEEIERTQVPTGAKVFVLGGWFGILGLLMNWIFERGRFYVRTIDIDPECTQWARYLHMFFWADRFRIVPCRADMMKLNYAEVEFYPWGMEQPHFEVPDLVINTSSEHIDQFSDWWNAIPFGTKVILQSNDFFAHVEHVNCVKSVADFKQTAKFSNLMYAGELQLPDFKRFMLVGER